MGVGGGLAKGKRKQSEQEKTKDRGLFLNLVTELGTEYANEMKLNSPAQPETHQPRTGREEHSWMQPAHQEMWREALREFSEAWGTFHKLWERGFRPFFSSLQGIIILWVLQEHVTLL